MTIMKKQYISPELFIDEMETEKVICGSITISGTGGDAGLSGVSDESGSTEGDARGYNLWDDEE